MKDSIPCKPNIKNEEWRKLYKIEEMSIKTMHSRKEGIAAFISFDRLLTCANAYFVHGRPTGKKF